MIEWISQAASHPEPSIPTCAWYKLKRSCDKLTTIAQTTYNRTLHPAHWLPLTANAYAMLEASLSSRPYSEGLKPRLSRACNQGFVAVSVIAIAISSKLTLR